MKIEFPKQPTKRNFGSLRVGQSFIFGNEAFIKAGLHGHAHGTSAVNYATGIVHNFDLSADVMPANGSLTLHAEVI